MTISETHDAFTPVPQGVLPEDGRQEVCRGLRHQRLRQGGHRHLQEAAAGLGDRRSTAPAANRANKVLEDLAQLRGSVTNLCSWKNGFVFKEAYLKVGTVFWL